MSKFIETQDSIVRTSEILYVTKDSEPEKNNLGAVVKIWQTFTIYFRHSSNTMSFRYNSEIDRDKNYEAMVKLLKEEDE